MQAARPGSDTSGRSFDDGPRTAETVPVPEVRVELTSAGQTQFPPGLSPFAPSAPSLLLFVFLISLTASLNLIQSRRLGITGRIFATPTPPATTVAGEALGRFAVALTQGLVIMVGVGVAVRRGLGRPARCRRAAAVLPGRQRRGNAARLAVPHRGSGHRGWRSAWGLGLGAVGGTMLPLELLSDPVRAVARFTPHAWGYEGFAELVRRGGGLSDILPQLGVLARFAVVLLGLGIWRLRQVVANPA